MKGSINKYKVFYKAAEKTDSKITKSYGMTFLDYRGLIAYHIMEETVNYDLLL